MDRLVVDVIYGFWKMVRHIPLEANYIRQGKQL